MGHHTSTCRDADTTKAVFIRCPSALQEHTFIRVTFTVCKPRYLQKMVEKWWLPKGENLGICIVKGYYPMPLCVFFGTGVVVSCLRADAAHLKMDVCVWGCVCVGGGSFSFKHLTEMMETSGESTFGTIKW